LVSGVVEVPLAEGGSVLVEVDEVIDGAVVRGRDAALPPLTQSLEQVLAGLGPATHALVSQLRALTDFPDEIEVEFAVKLSADARVVIARVGSEANFRIVLKWGRSTDALPLGGSEG
jgi:Trypsin-co-occurring domain 1